MKKVIAPVQPELKKRKCLRYKRSDIEIYLFRKITGFTRVKLLNISQYGLAIRCCFNLKNKAYIKLVVAFNGSNQFELTGHIVSKNSVVFPQNNVNSQRKWFIFGSLSSMYDYGIDFDDTQDVREFSSYLLRSNISKRLKHHNDK